MRRSAARARGRGVAAERTPGRHRGIPDGASERGGPAAWRRPGRAARPQLQVLGAAPGPGRPAGLDGSSGDEPGADEPLDHHVRRGRGGLELHAAAQSGASGGRLGVPDRAPQHPDLRGRRGRGGDGAGLRGRAPGQPAVGGQGHRPDAHGPADPRAAGRHRQHVEAHVQFRVRRLQSDAHGRGARPGKLARLGRLRALVDRRRHLALDAVRLPHPARGGRGAAGRRHRGCPCRWREPAADAVPHHHPADVAGALGSPDVPHDLRVQGVRRGIPFDLGRPRHRDRSRRAYIYKVFFAQNQLGYGALLSITVILAVSVFIFTYRRFARLRSEA